MGINSKQRYYLYRIIAIIMYCQFLFVVNLSSPTKTEKEFEVVGWHQFESTTFLERYVYHINQYVIIVKKENGDITGVSVDSETYNECMYLDKKRITLAVVEELSGVPETNILAKNRILVCTISFILFIISIISLIYRRNKNVSGKYKRLDSISYDR